MDNEIHTTFTSTNDAIYSAFGSVIESIHALSYKLLMSELQKLLDNKEISAHIPEGISKYIYTAGFLSIIGKEITRENMYMFLNSIGIEPRYDFIDMILKMNIESHLAYIYVYYFLIASGRDINVANMKTILEMIGLTPNSIRMAFIIKYIQKEDKE